MVYISPIAAKVLPDLINSAIVLAEGDRFPGIDCSFFSSKRANEGDGDGDVVMVDFQ
jgi:hypothetical protein